MIVINPLKIALIKRIAIALIKSIAIRLAIDLINVFIGLIVDV